MVDQGSAHLAKGFTKVSEVDTEDSLGTRVIAYDFSVPHCGNFGCIISEETNELDEAEFSLSSRDAVALGRKVSVQDFSDLAPPERSVG